VINIIEIKENEIRVEYRRCYVHQKALIAEGLI
jgi:hypothetical protein